MRCAARARWRSARRARRHGRRRSPSSRRSRRSAQLPQCAAPALVVGAGRCGGSAARDGPVAHGGRACTPGPGPEPRRCRNRRPDPERRLAPGHAVPMARGEPCGGIPRAGAVAERSRARASERRRRRTAAGDRVAADRGTTCSATRAIHVALRRVRREQQQHPHVGVGPRETTMTAWRQRCGQSVMLALAAFLLAPATAAAPQGDATFAAWTQAPSAAEAEAALQAVLERLQPEQIRPYLEEVGKALAKMPPALRGATGRRLLAAHLPLLTRAAADFALVDWFAIESADFLAANDDPEGALALLADTAPLLRQPPPSWGRRWRLEIDCLIELQQLVAADRRCGEIEALVAEPLERARLLARRATLDVMLGRLDQASRRLAAAARQLDELPGVGADELRSQRFKLLRRQLDLLSANEQF